MGFLDYFSDLWAPYGTEDDQIQAFVGPRGYDNFPAQYNTGKKKYKTYTYDVDSLCSFMIVFKVDLGMFFGGDSLGSSYYLVMEAISMFPNPDRIAWGEPIKQEITKLQFNSTIIERGGMPLKNLSISGNFGFFPGHEKVAPQGKLPRNGVGSGLFFSMLWSSFFRYYEEIVSYDTEASNFSLVFVDHVKQEAWFVEPNSIDSEQNKTQKFQHPYSWTFTAFAPYDFNFWPITSIWDDISNIAADLKEYAAELERFAARLSKFVTDFVDTILGPINDLIDAIDSFLSAVDIVKSISTPKQIIEQIANELKDLQEALDFSKDDDGYPLEIDSAYAVQNVRKQLKKIIATQELFIPESNYSNNQTSVLYEAPRMNKETGEILERGDNAPIISTETIKSGDTIQSVAKRVFGTFNGWEEIVTLNGLKPPYIASQADIDSKGLKGVIAYGKNISFTVNGKFSTKKVSRKKSTTPFPIINDTTRTKNLTPFERALGTDIALIDGDIQWTRDNDFKTVSGLNNMKQQISHKFSIEKGKLRSAEYIGITKVVGKDGALGEFQMRQDIESMVNADKRLAGVSIESEKSGDVLRASANIDIKDIKEPLKVQLTNATH